MCGIAGVVALRDDAERADARSAGRHGRRAPAPRPRRVRPLPRRPRRPGPRPAVDHRPVERPAADGQRGPAACGSSSTARSSTTSSCATSSRRSATASAPAATPRSSSTPTRQWGDEAFRRFNGQWAIALWDRARADAGAGPRSASACGRCTSAEHARPARISRSEVKAIFAADAVDPARASTRSASTQIFTFWTPVPPQTVFAGVTRARARRACASTPTARSTDARAWDPSYPGDGRRGFRGSLDDAVDAVRAALERRHQPAHAARRRAGRQLSLGRPRQLARRGARPARQGRAVLDVLAALRGRRVRRDRLPAPDGRAPRQRSPRGRGVARATSRACSPTSSRHTERPILRTAPAPLFLLSKLVRDAGIKVVLTGEGADEMFAGYDLFREAKVRRFWAREPESTWRPRLLERLYPYLARSPVSQRAMARQFFGQQLGALARARASATICAGARPPRCGACSRRRCARGQRRPRRARRAARRRCRTAFAPLDAAGPGPVPRDPHPAVRLPALGAGRSHADGALGRGALPVPRSSGRARSPTRCRRPTSCACSTRSTCSSGPRADARAGRDPGAQEAAVSRARRAVVRRRRGAGVDRRGRRARARSPRPACSRRPAVAPGDRASAGPGRRRGSSRTPTTWRSSACCRRSWSTTSSSAAGPKAGRRFRCAPRSASPAATCRRWRLAERASRGRCRPAPCAPCDVSRCAVELADSLGVDGSAHAASWSATGAPR